MSYFLLIHYVLKKKILTNKETFNLLNFFVFEFYYINLKLLHKSNFTCEVNLKSFLKRTLKESQNYISNKKLSSCFIDYSFKHKIMNFQKFYINNPSNTRKFFSNISSYSNVSEKIVT
jgi:hypothetical protein